MKKIFLVIILSLPWPVYGHSYGDVLDYATAATIGCITGVASAACVHYLVNVLINNRPADQGPFSDRDALMFVCGGLGCLAISPVLAVHGTKIILYNTANMQQLALLADLGMSSYYVARATHSALFFVVPTFVFKLCASLLINNNIKKFNYKG